MRAGDRRKPVIAGRRRSLLIYLAFVLRRRLTEMQSYSTPQRVLLSNQDPRSQIRRDNNTSLIRVYDNNRLK